MEITKEGARKYLEKGQEGGNPVLVHGTSVESAIELIRDGTMKAPSNRPNSNHPIDNGYLFFVPRKSAFVNHSLYSSIDVNLEEGSLEDSVYQYARTIQEFNFLRDVLGYWPSDKYPIYFVSGELSLEELENANVDVGKIRQYGIRKLGDDVEKRKGVVLGINEKIFEKNIEDGCDVPGREVMIYLPDGLDRKYLDYVYPFGDLEKNALEEFVESLA